MARKLTQKYYFSVEGETEKWYLEWLEECINNIEQSYYKVKFDCKVEKNPVKRVKKMTISSKTEIWHLSDVESQDEFHVKQFRDTIDKLKEASNIGKKVNYKFGYSNLTFDLWIILHKTDCTGAKVNRKQYIHTINKVYQKKFNDMDDYKHEDHFSSCLSQLNIDNVKKAIERSKNIMKRNEQNGYQLQQYKGYEFYKENPSLMIWQIIEKILKDCKLL